MATHCSILAWRVPRTEEPGSLKSTGSQENQTRLTLSLFTLPRRTSKFSGFIILVGLPYFYVPWSNSENPLFTLVFFFFCLLEEDWEGPRFSPALSYQPPSG